MNEYMNAAFALDEWCMDHMLTVIEYTLMRKLLYLAYKNGFPQRFTISNTMLAAMVGCSWEPLRQARARLVEVGLIRYAGHNGAEPRYEVRTFGMDGADENAFENASENAFTKQSSERSDGNAFENAFRKQTEKQTDGIALRNAFENAFKKQSERKKEGIAFENAFRKQSEPDFGVNYYSYPNLDRTPEEDIDNNNIIASASSSSVTPERKSAIGVYGEEDAAADLSIAGEKPEESAADYLRKAGIALARPQYEAIREFRESGVSDEILKYAADEAVEHGALNFAYIRRIVDGLICAGVKTVAEAKARKTEFHRSNRDSPKREEPAQPKARFFADRWND